MFFLKFLAIWTGLHLYVLWRLTTVQAITRRLSRQGLAAVVFLLWASFIAAHVLDHAGAGAWAYPLELFGSNWMGVLLLLFFCLSVVDLITCFGLWFKKRLALLQALALAAAGFLSLTALVQGMRPPVITRYEVVLPGLPAEADGAVLAVIADTHLGSLLGPRWMKARAAQIQALHPDMILAVGDIIEGHGALERENRTLPVMRTLSSPLGVWAVAGNHELHGEDDSGVRFLEKAGMHVLRNSWKEVRPGLVVAGVDDPGHYGPPPKDWPRTCKALDGVPSQSGVIFLSHRPEGAEAAAKAGAGLMLSGHTHGGQLWPFIYLTRWKYPLFAGLYQVDGMTALVCRGTGTWGPRMRLWRPGEILRVTLRSSQ